MFKYKQAFGNWEQGRDHAMIGSTKRGCGEFPRMNSRPSQLLHVISLLTITINEEVNPSVAQRKVNKFFTNEGIKLAKI